MGPQLISNPRPLIQKEGRIDNKMLPNERNNPFKKHNKVIWETAFEITQQTKKTHRQPHGAKIQVFVG